MSVRRVLAVVACLLIGTGIGGVRDLTGDQAPERTCVETEPDATMECSDGTTCYWVNGVWVCDSN